MKNNVSAENDPIKYHWNSEKDNGSRNDADYERKSRSLNILGPIVTIFLLMIIMVCYTSHIIRNVAVANIHEVGKDRISSVAATLDNYLEITKNTLWMTADTVDHLLKEGASTDSILKYLIEESQSQKEHFDENYTGIYGYVRGEYLDGVEWIPPENFEPTTRDWYKFGIAAKGKAAIVPPYVDAQTGAVIISIARSLNEERNVLSMDVTLNYIQNFIKELHIKGKGYGYIVDSSGMIIAHPDISLRGKYLEGNQINELILSKAKDIKYGNFEIETSKGTNTVFIQELVDQWYIVITVSNSELYAEVWSQLLVNSLICTVIFILIILFYTLGYKNEQNYSRRIEEMRAQEQQKEYEAQVLKLEKESADRANQAKSCFLADMSHEIRTPINAVLGMNKMILRESVRSRDSCNASKDMLKAAFRNIAGYARNVESAGSNLLAIINNILDFSKIEAGKMDIVEGTYHLSSVLNDLSNMIHFKAQDKKLDFSINVDETLPNTLYGDEVRIRQILTNLLNNAVKYTEHGFVRLVIRDAKVNKTSIGDCLTMKISVQDSGVGISKKDQKSLFNKFQRFDLQRNSTVEGTGLGLAITNSLIALMHGSIEVKSEYGKGTEFTVTLPQKVVSLEPIGDFHVQFQKTFQETEVWRETFQAPDAKILIVDDTNMNIAVVVGLLENTLLQIDTASSGDEALALTKDNFYDLILMDQRMPKMDGTETLHRIRAQKESPNWNTPIICLTADAVIGARDKYISEGFTDYLTKPIECAALEETLIKYLPPEKVLMIHKEKSENSAFSGVVVQQDEFAILKNAGIDFETGIKYCQNDISLYKMMLEEYIRGSQEKLHNLDRFLKDRNWSEYAVLVHSIKSSSKMIGANELSDTAATLESASDKSDRVTVENTHSRLIARLESTLEAIRSITSGNESVAEDDEIIEFFPDQK